MRDDITTIPVTEVFEPRDGCPICRLRDLMEKRVVEYITGAALMEPDVRLETNRLGFCIDHYRMLLAQRHRLGVALMLESRLAEVDKQTFAGLPLIGKSARKQGRDAAKQTQTCFVCEKVDWAMERMLATVCRTWEQQRDFRQLFSEQPSLCLPHFEQLVRTAETAMSKKAAPDFLKEASAISRRALDELRADVSHFCKMFDYRNNTEEADWGNSKDSIERSIAWLTSRT